MKKIKTVLALLLMACMLTGMLPAGAAFADGGAPAGQETVAEPQEKQEAGGSGGADEDMPCDHTKDGGEAGRISAFHEGVCEICGFACTHDSWSDGKCSVCGLACEPHSFHDGVCTRCGFACAHEGEPSAIEAKEASCTEDGCTAGTKCAVCGATLSGCEKIPAGHKWEDRDGGRICSVCGLTCEAHSFQDSVCTNCGYVCSHTENGASLFENDVCTRCGFTCQHEKLDENNDCLSCGKHIQAQVLDIKGQSVKSYTTLQEALKEITNDGAIFLTEDVAVTEPICFKNNLTLELYGHSLTGSLQVTAGTLSISGGSVIQEGNSAAITVSAPAGLILYRTASVSGGVLIENGANADISGTISGTDAALEIGGGDAETRINIRNDAELTANGTAIHMQSGTLNISGGTISGGETGVEACAGTVQISGGAITGKRAIYEHGADGGANIAVTGVSLTGEVKSENNKVTFSGEAAGTAITTTPQIVNGAAVVDTSSVHAGANNCISAGSAAKVVLPKSALEECASSADTSVQIQNNAASLTLDGAALAAINTAAGSRTSATVYVYEIADAAEKSYAVGIEDENGTKIALSAAGLGSGKATLILNNVGTEPKEVRHYNDDGTTLIEILPFTYNADAKTVTVTLGSFSKVVLSAVETPSITTATLPEAALGREYTQMLTATGTAPITWTVKAGTLPQGLTLSTDGVLSGTVTQASEKGAHTVTLMAENAAGTAEKELTISVVELAVAQVLDSKGQVVSEHASVQAAIDAATDDQTILLLADTTEEVVVDGKDVALDGSAAKHTVKSLTVKTASTAMVENIKAERMIIENGAGAALGAGNDIAVVQNSNTKPDKNDRNYPVIITGGHYGRLSPASGAHYLVTGGSFDSEVPMEYCREVKADGTVTQRCSKYSSLTKAYQIENFRLKITEVSNSGYHMPGSIKTLVFTTNLQYSLMEPKQLLITNSDNTSVKNLMSSAGNEGYYYTITENANGMAEITLTARCLNSLKIGKYLLQYEDELGSAGMYFHISSTVKTGDTSNIGLWVAIAGVSVLLLCGVAAALILQSRKKSGGGAAAEKHRKRKDEHNRKSE